MFEFSVFSSCMLCVLTGNTPADVGFDAIDCMDTDLMNELTPNDTVISPTRFDCDSLPDGCADIEMTLDADNDLLDSVSLEEFMDLAEFLVSSTACS